MSVSLYFHPVDAAHLISGTSSTVEVLEKVFGDRFPLDFGPEDHKMLLAMGLAHAGMDNPYIELANAVNKYGRIRVEAMY